MALQIIDSVTQLQRDLTGAEQTEVRSGLGLGTAATTAATAYATAAQGAKADTAVQPSGVKTINGQSVLGSGDLVLSPNISASQIADSTAAGRSVLTAADPAAQRAAIGLGTAALSAAGDFATAAQGAKADTAIQASGMPAAMLTGYHTMTAAQRVEFGGVSYAATQPNAAEYIWWVSPLNAVWNSNGSTWIQIV